MSAKKLKIKSVVVSLVILSGLMSALIAVEAGIYAPPAYPGPERGVDVGSGVFLPTSAKTSLPSAGIEMIIKKVGEIKADRSYAWAENSGWINFRAKGAELKVGGNILAGWALMDNLGWVHFGNGQPENGWSYSNRHGRDYGVNNDGQGGLSGWAWSETAGWISFDGVMIAAGGDFYGFADSRNIGKIIFQSGCFDGALVKTDPYPWRAIGTSQEMRAGSYPGGGEIVAVISGAYSFTVSSSSSSLSAPFLSSALISEMAGGENLTPIAFGDDRCRSRIERGVGLIRGPPVAGTIELTLSVFAGDNPGSKLDVCRVFYACEFEGMAPRQSHLQRI